MNRYAFATRPLQAVPHNRTTRLALKRINRRLSVDALVLLAASAAYAGPFEVSPPRLGDEVVFEYVSAQAADPDDPDAPAWDSRFWIRNSGQVADEMDEGGTASAAPTIVRLTVEDLGLGVKASKYITIPANGTFAASWGLLKAEMLWPPCPGVGGPAIDLSGLQEAVLRFAAVTSYHLPECDPFPPGTAGGPLWGDGAYIAGSAFDDGKAQGFPLLGSVVADEVRVGFLGESESDIFDGSDVMVYCPDTCQVAIRAKTEGGDELLLSGSPVRVEMIGPGPTIFDLDAGLGPESPFGVLEVRCTVPDSEPVERAACSIRVLSFAADYSAPFAALYLDFPDPATLAECGAEWLAIAADLSRGALVESVSHECLAALYARPGIKGPPAIELACFSINGEDCPAKRRARGYGRTAAVERAARGMGGRPIHR